MSGDICVYQHRHPGTPNIFYVGIGKSYRPYYKHGRNHLWEAVAIKYNWNHDVDILYNNVSLEFARDKEIELIARYGRVDNGTGVLTNMTDGGVGGNGCPRTDNQVKNLRYKNSKWIIYQIDPITSQIISVSFGTKEAEKQSGVNHKTINASLNKQITSGGFYWSGVLNEDYCRSNEIRKVKNTSSYTENARLKTSKFIVQQIDLSSGKIIEEFIGAPQASIQTGISLTCIRECMDKKRESIGGYGWNAVPNPEYVGGGVKGRVVSLEAKLKLCKWLVKMIDPSTGRVVAEYNGINEASLTTGRPRGNIRKCINGSRPLCGGYKWIGELNPLCKERVMRKKSA